MSRGVRAILVVFILIVVIAVVVAVIVAPGGRRGGEDGEGRRGPHGGLHVAIIQGGSLISAQIDSDRS